MSNVVDLFSKVATAPKETPKDDAEEFIEHFYDWCVQQGVDVTEEEFKYDAAVIMTSLQSIMHKVNRGRN